MLILQLDVSELQFAVLAYLEFRQIIESSNGVLIPISVP